MSTATELDVTVLEGLDFDPACYGQELDKCTETATHIGTLICPACGTGGFPDQQTTVLMGPKCIAEINAWVASVHADDAMFKCFICLATYPDFPLRLEPLR